MRKLAILVLVSLLLTGCTAAPSPTPPPSVATHSESSAWKNEDKPYKCYSGADSQTRAEVYSLADTILKDDEKLTGGIAVVPFTTAEGSLLEKKVVMFGVENATGGRYVKTYLASSAEPDRWLLVVDNNYPADKPSDLTDNEWQAVGMARNCSGA